MYFSFGEGESWQQSGAGLNPEATVTSIVFDPTNSEMVYLSNQFSGVYRSIDGGVSWETFNNGLMPRSTNALSLSSDGQHLYAATEGGGVFRLDMNNQVP